MKIPADCLAEGAASRSPHASSGLLQIGRGRQRPAGARRCTAHQAHRHRPRQPAPSPAWLAAAHPQRDSPLRPRPRWHDRHCSHLHRDMDVTSCFMAADMTHHAVLFRINMMSSTTSANLGLGIPSTAPVAVGRPWMAEQHLKTLGEMTCLTNLKIGRLCAICLCYSSHQTTSGVEFPKIQNKLPMIDHDQAVFNDHNASLTDELLEIICGRIDLPLLQEGPCSEQPQGCCSLP